MSRQTQEASDTTRVSSCPDCESGTVERTGVFEHLSCGYVDAAEAFTGASSDGVRCPKCSERLSMGGDAVPQVATVYRCVDCDRRFDSLESARIEQIPSRLRPTDVAARKR